MMRGAPRNAATCLGLSGPDEPEQRPGHYVLTNAERWVVREALSSLPRAELLEYMIHKCEKNDIPKHRARWLLDILDLDGPDTDALLDRYVKPSDYG